VAKRERIAAPEPLIAHESDRVHFQQDRRGAQLVAGFGVEDVGLAHAHLECLHLRRMLMEKVTEIGGVRPRVANCCKQDSPIEKVKNCTATLR